MNLKTRLVGKLQGAIIAAAITAVSGVCLWYLQVGVALSYDFPFVFVLQTVTNDVIIVKMDEASHVALKQEYGLWKRTIHAELLDKLRKDQSGFAIFDVLFSDSGEEWESAELVRAIANHGKVILVGEVEHPGPRYSGILPQPPRQEYREAAKWWGVPDVYQDDDSTVRRYHPLVEQFPSLPWIAAVQAGAPIADSVPARMQERWLRYYGPKGTIPTVSYVDATKMSDGFFKGKTVFIGGKPLIVPPTELSDRFRTPYTRWSQGLTPGVEIHATTFLNLLRGDWLMRLSTSGEFTLVVIVGILCGFGLNLVRPLAGAGLALLGMVAVIASVLWLFWNRNLWFDWVVIAGFQIPGAWICSVVTHTQRTDRENEALEQRLSTSRTSPHTPTVVFPEVQVPEVRGNVVVPDHELVRCIGKGAYGEVWLARNAIGTYHAAKIVYRGDFTSNNSYAREFKGIQKYMPISRKYPGFVQILHTGRNDAAGYYYCIMECGDDERDGSIIRPDSYSPRNLSKDLRRRGRIPVPECVALAISLADTLDFLHRHGLIHRDVKPSNIIFVNGTPKLADIGLVTDIVKSGDAMTGVGTFGYIAPEGPGNPPADIYALGKVMYVAAMGRDIDDFPALATFVDGTPEAGVLLRLNAIILKACDELNRRYQRASDLREDLLTLQGGLDSSHKG